MKLKGGDYFVLAISLFFLTIGIRMLVKNIVTVGKSWNMEGSVLGGPIFIFLGLIFLFVFYTSLSPFSRIRQFFEGRTSKNQKTKNARKNTDE